MQSKQLNFFKLIQSSYLFAHQLFQKNILTFKMYLYNTIHTLTPVSLQYIFNQGKLPARLASQTRISDSASPSPLFNIIVHCPHHHPDSPHPAFTLNHGSKKGSLVFGKGIKLNYLYHCCVIDNVVNPYYSIKVKVRSLR